MSENSLRLLSIFSMSSLLVTNDNRIQLLGERPKSHFDLTILAKGMVIHSCMCLEMDTNQKSFWVFFQLFYSNQYLPIIADNEPECKQNRKE